MGTSPELERPDPAFVVILVTGAQRPGGGGGGGGPAAPGGSVGRNSTDLPPGSEPHDVCVLVGADPSATEQIFYTDVDISGLTTSGRLTPEVTCADWRTFSASQRTTVVNQLVIAANLYEAVRAAQHASSSTSSAELSAMASESVTKNCEVQGWVEAPIQALLRALYGPGSLSEPGPSAEATPQEASPSQATP
jgi:hypothetical protein